MIKFLKGFVVETVINGLGSDTNEEQFEKVQAQFVDIAEHFSFAYTRANVKTIDIPDNVRNRGNVVAFGTGQMFQIRWKCMISMDKWKAFVENADEYLKDKEYANFTVYIK